MIAGLLEVARPGEVISEVAALTLRRDAVTLALDDERRDPDRRQHAAHIDRPDHAQHPLQGAGGHGQPLPVSKGLTGPRDVGEAGRVPLDALALSPARRGKLVERAQHLV